MKKARIFAIVAFAGLTLTGLAGCGRGEEGAILPEKGVRQYSASRLDPAVVDASNRFGLSLYGRLTEAKESDGNVFMSPLSVSAALALVARGAAGETDAGMSKALGLEGMTNDHIGSGYRVLLDLLRHPNDDDVIMTFASSLWMAGHKMFNPGFISGSVSDYAAETFAYDAEDDSAAKRMNDWAAKRTDGAIKKVIDRIDPNSALYVLNAIDFDGAWTSPFNAAVTNRARFHPTGFPSEEDFFVQMMTQGGLYEYAKLDGYETIRLPIGKKDSAYLAVVLPDKAEDALAKLQAKLAADPKILTGKLESRRGTIELPKTQFAYSANLNEELKAMGMETAFDPLNASFPGINDEPQTLFISNVEHFSSFEMNEDGVSASAATIVEVEVGAASPPPEEPFRMSVDRPFVVGIVDRETGVILFVGTVSNPNAE
ncbi:serpin family protein [Cohnella suwonensis]|uniref:Serpin family protein n=1 Tax=Cohnella suwonensis TaxID=696072 RepID=A0ABW0LSK9_9BACL